MKIRIFGVMGVCAGVAALAFSGQARAQLPSWIPPGHFYLGGEAGWTGLEDQTARITGAPLLHEDYGAGYALGVRGGYQMGPWRIEEEYMYRNNGLNSLSAGSLKLPGVSGSRSSNALMTNVLYDFDTLGWPVIPHIGVGIGAVDVIDQNKVAGIGQFVNASEWEFGYQAIAGASYSVTPNLSLEVDYRYMATTDETYHLSAAPRVAYHTGYGTQNIITSLVYHFLPPPAPPVVAPAAAPAPPPVTRKVFLVFFDWDRATITPEGMNIVRQAADAYKSGSPVQLQVTGYTDRSGSAAYNQRLSERRANNVADALVRFGVPRDQMTVSGRGENDNRVPTANGVREPQNRRVEIVFP